MERLDLWLSQHPLAKLFIAIIVLGALSALANFFARTSTPEGWEVLKKERPRLAGALSLLRGLGVDPVKIVNALRAIVGNRWGAPPPDSQSGRKTDPETPKSKPPTGPLLLIATLCVGCSFTLPQRESTRAALVFSAKSLVLANEVCAETAYTVSLLDRPKGKAIAHACSVSTRTALNALLTADAALEVAEAPNVACAATTALKALQSLAATVTAAGGSMPKAATDAVNLLSALAGFVGVCK